MKLKNPKAKGDAFERYVSEIIRGYGFKDTYRTPMSGAIKNVSGLAGDLRGKQWPFFTEIKKTETTHFWKWYNKANDEAGPQIPVIIWSKNRSEPFIFLLLSDFMRAITDKTILKEKYKKPPKPQKPSLADTANFKFSKLHQIRKKNKG